MEHFGKELWTIEEYKQKKKFSFIEYTEVQKLFGIPSEETPILSKKQIAKACDSDSQTLRECVLIKPHFYGLTKEAYLSMSKFPPSISQKIINAYK